jgi:benzoylformate decarboxylase
VRANRVIALDLVDPVIDFLALATAMGVDWCRVDRARDIARRSRPASPRKTANLVELIVRPG